MKKHIPLKAGDQITWVSARGTIVWLTWQLSVVYGSNTFPLSEEGITWCRGVLKSNSPEGKALIVAAALARDT